MIKQVKSGAHELSADTKKVVLKDFILALVSVEVELLGALSSKTFEICEQSI
jgi:hypothetical protein